MNPADFQGRIIVVMPARNEGPEAVRTVRNLRKQKAPGTRLHFFVIDDGSTDGCCHILKPAKDITVITNPVPLGQGIGRSLGVFRYIDDPDAVRGFVEIDAHIRMLTPYGPESLVLAAEETGGIVGCRSAILDKPATESRAGHTWTKPKPGVDARSLCAHQWAYLPLGEKHKGPMLVQRDVPQGATYAFTGATFRKLGRFGESRGAYGFADIDIGVNCKFLGIPYLIHSGVASAHLYRKKRPYPMTGVWWFYGYIECFRSMFRPDTWTRVFRPGLAAAWKDIDTPLLEYLLRDPHLEDRQQTYETRKVCTDEQVLEWMGLAAS